MSREKLSFFPIQGRPQRSTRPRPSLPQVINLREVSLGSLHLERFLFLSFPLVLGLVRGSDPNAHGGTGGYRLRGAIDPEPAPGLGLSRCTSLDGLAVGDNAIKFKSFRTLQRPSKFQPYASA
jgi:hypothetical protein